ncbi:vomeronasal type-2 receptor 26-like [Lithobates pipiens]
MKCSPVFCVCYLLILILPITYYGVVLTRSSAPGCRMNMAKPVLEYKYYQEGDFIIGGLISAHLRSVYVKNLDGALPDESGSYRAFSFCDRVDVEEYKSILAIMIAVWEINDALNILPNVTLGYHLFSTCNDPMKSMAYIIRILSGEKEAPNYYCKGRGEFTGFIGDSTFHTNYAMAQLLSMYRYTQDGATGVYSLLNGTSISAYSSLSTYPSS